MLPFSTLFHQTIMIFDIYRQHMEKVANMFAVTLRKKIEGDSDIIVLIGYQLLYYV